jgi:hypothetical protein
MIVQLTGFTKPFTQLSHYPYWLNLTVACHSELAILFPSNPWRSRESNASSTSVFSFGIDILLP